MTGLLLSRLRAWVAIANNYRNYPDIEPEREATVDLLTSLQGPDSPPEIDVAGLSPGEVLMHLDEGNIPKHCFLKIGHARHRIRPETLDAFKRGLLVASELCEQLDMGGSSKSAT